MAQYNGRRTLQLVTKITKYCNLRCTYCYEYPDLDKKERMTTDNLSAFFRHVADFARKNKIDSVDFLWHGGEPLLIPLVFYDEIASLQKDAFGDGVNYSNSMQTNLTVLTDRHVAWLRDKAFLTSIGVSFDVLGDQRIDKTGQSRTKAIAANMQKLIDNGIHFGAISVLSRATLPHVRQIYRFFDSMGIGSRFLPFYMNAYEKQVQEHALTHAEIVAGLSAVFDAWLQSEDATPALPVSEYLDYATTWLGGGEGATYNIRENECVFIVNTNGDTYGIVHAYDPEYLYGNIFRQSLDEILASPGRTRAVGEAEARVERHCSGCKYFGACSGHFAASATPQQQSMLETSGCLVAGVIDHMVARLEKVGLEDRLRERAAQAVEAHPFAA
jgi:uncharacterized protein